MLDFNNSKGLRFDSLSSDRTRGTACSTDTYERQTTETTKNVSDQKIRNIQMWIGWCDFLYKNCM